MARPSLVDEVLKDAVVVKTVSRSHYFVQVLGKPTMSLSRKGDAEMRQAEWLTALSWVVVKTATACARLIGDQYPEAGGIILEAVAQPLEDLADGHTITEADSG